MDKKKYQKEIKKIVRQIVEKYNPEKIILFGSFAYGKPKENSDVDLLIIKKTRKRFSARLFEICQYVKSWLGADIIIYTPKEIKESLDQESYFIKEIMRKGKLVYEK